MVIIWCDPKLILVNDKRDNHDVIIMQLFLHVVINFCDPKPYINVLLLLNYELTRVILKKQIDKQINMIIS